MNAKEHLAKWIESECYPISRDDEEFKACFDGMWNIREDDPDFWDERGWRRVYDYLQETSA